uniref:hypothetical protein n=1 Tax=Salmonella sp. SAL4445 TaxID=3159900 RepID=UPI0039787912
EKNYRQFFKVAFPAPLGTLRYTNLIGGFIGNGDGSSQTWVYRDFVLGRVSQGVVSFTTVSWIDMANLDFVWDGYIADYGVHKRACVVYQ